MLYYLLVPPQSFSSELTNTVDGNWSSFAKFCPGVIIRRCDFTQTATKANNMSTVSLFMFYQCATEETVDEVRFMY